MDWICCFQIVQGDNTNTNEYANVDHVICHVLHIGGSKTMRKQTTDSDSWRRLGAAIIVSVEY